MYKFADTIAPVVNKHHGGDEMLEIKIYYDDIRDIFPLCKQYLILI